MKTTTIHRLTLGGLLLTSGAPLLAQEGADSLEKRFGVGLMVGEPTGASFKYWFSEVSAIDGVVGWSLADHTGFNLHADYLYHLNHLIDVNPGRLPVYFGGGVRYKAWEDRDDLFGFRAVAGLAYLFHDIPVDIFFEVGPIFDVAPDFKVRYTVGVGARYWF